MGSFWETLRNFLAGAPPQGGPAEQTGGQKMSDVTKMTAEEVDAYMKEHCAQIVWREYNLPSASEQGLANKRG